MWSCVQKIFHFSPQLYALRGKTGCHSKIVMPQTKSPGQGLFLGVAKIVMPRAKRHAAGCHPVMLCGYVTR
jgi:hypothetical protein